jgi:hypothetical protein
MKGIKRQGRRPDLYSILRPLWIDLDPPHDVACWLHANRLKRPSLITSGGRDLRKIAWNHGRSVCEVNGEQRTV